MTEPVVEEPDRSADTEATLTAQLHSVDALMKRLSVGRNTVFNLMASGQLRSIKIGRRRVVSENAVRDFIARIDDQAGA